MANNISAASVLGLEGFEVLDQQSTTDKYGMPMQIFTIVSTKPTPPCPNCKSRNVYKKQTRPKDVRDLDTPLGRTTLHILTKGYQCNKCGKNFTENMDFVLPKHTITKRMVNHVAQQALDLPYDRVAANTGLDPKTIFTAFKAWVKERDKLRNKGIYCPTVLGIDECHLSPDGRSDGMRGVFVDVNDGRVLDITRDRYKETVIKWLEDLPDSSKLKVVTIDMWKAYRDAVYEVFGDSVLVVVDHYHVIQELMKQMQYARNAVISHLPEGSMKKHKNNLSLLKTNIEDLTEDGKTMLTELFRDVPELKKVYALKESFRAIYNVETREEAEEAFEKWVAQIPPKNDDFKPFFSVARTVRAWHKEIFNFFDTDGASNAITEAMNGIIKRVNRLGNGYSFEVLRAKILYGAGTKAFIRTKKPKYTTSSTPLTIGYVSTNWKQTMPTKTVVKYVDVMEYRGAPIKQLLMSLHNGTFFGGDGTDFIDEDGGIDSFEILDFVPTDLSGEEDDEKFY